MISAWLGFKGAAGEQAGMSVSVDLEHAVACGAVQHSDVSVKPISRCFVLVSRFTLSASCLASWVQMYAGQQDSSEHNLGAYGLQKLLVTHLQPVTFPTGYNSEHG